jgi:hypothetical protein
MNMPWFVEDLLVIPDLKLGRNSYWVELRLTGPNAFILDSYGLNRQQGHDFPGGSGYPDGPAFQEWIRISDDARDIGFGADGTVCVLGGITYGNFDHDFFNDDIDVDFGLWVLDEFGWLEYPGSGIRLDVDPDGFPWVVNSDQEIWRLTPFDLDRIPGRANNRRI